MIGHWASRAARLVPLALMAGLLSVGGTARADETTSFSGEVMTLPPGSAPLARFDISFVDSRLGIYILADRSNAQVEVFSVVGRKFLWFFFFVGFRRHRRFWPWIVRHAALQVKPSSRVARAASAPAEPR